MSSSDLRTPSAHGIPKSRIFSGSNLQNNNLHTPSPTSELPSPTYQQFRNARTQSSPTPIQRNFAKKPAGPPTSRTRRPRTSTGSQSVPDATLAARADVSIEGGANQGPGSEKKVFSSPCGEIYKTPGGLERHNKRRDHCEFRSTKTQTDATDETIWNTERKHSSELAEVSEVDTGPVARSDRGPPGENMLSHDRKTSTDVIDLTGSDHDISGSDSVPGKINEMSNRKSSRGIDRELPDPNEKNGSGVVTAEELGLEDSRNPEGTLPSTHEIKKYNATKFHKMIQANLEKPLTKNDQAGFIYIFFDPKNPKLHKIGRSLDPEFRKNQLKSRCRLNLELIGSTPVSNYCRTELLIQTYLSDLCEPWDCSRCGKKHVEWFVIEKDAALAAVKLWTDFMMKETPYDIGTGQLQPFIKDLIRSRDHLLPAADRNIETTREHWKRNLSPTFLDHYHLEYSGMWGLLWKYYWPINTMFAWTVAFVVSPHSITFAFMAASVIGTFVRMSGENHRLLRSSMSSKRK